MDRKKPHSQREVVPALRLYVRLWSLSHNNVYLTMIQVALSL